MIDAIGGFLQHNLVVFLAIVLVPMKWVVLRVCGDSDAQAGALLAVPEDICYVSLGLVLGNLATSLDAFKRHFQGSNHVYMDVFVTAGANVIVAIIVHLCAEFGNDHLKSWRASNKAISRTSDISGDRQFELPITPIDENIRMIGIRHLVQFSLAYALQLTVAVWWLSWVANVLSSV